MATDWSERIRVADMSDEPEFTEELRQLTQLVEKKSDDKHVVLDLSEVSYVNSSHLAMLLRLRRELTEAQRRLHICGTRDPVWSVMTLTGLDKVFDFFDNKVTAIASLQLDETGV
ncbi:MAG: STAS domain-containing protein [Phycisphaerales bacterium JB038]